MEELQARLAPAELPTAEPRHQDAESEQPAQIFPRVSDLAHQGFDTRNVAEPKRIFGTYKFQDWRTPRALFDALHAILHFDLDAFASPHNALLPCYWTEQDDAFSKEWCGLRVFANPPFTLAGRALPLARKADLAVVIMAWSTLFTRAMKNYPPDHLLLPIVDPENWTTG